MLRAGARHPDADELTPSGSGAPPPAEAAPPALDALYAALAEYLLLEHKFQPRLCLPADSELQKGEVTIGARDGAVHVLRCLKVWFDLPAAVVIHAVNLLDRFLTKMKVRPCHVPCLTVSCMNVAIDAYAQLTRQPRTVSIEELVAVSQSACTAGDVSRMSRVIYDKLALAEGLRAISALEWIQLLRSLVVAAAANAQFPDPLCPEDELVSLLEIVICDATCANARISELALVLVYHKLEQQVVEWSRADGGKIPEDMYYLYEYGEYLQALCHMSDASLVSTRGLVRAVMSRYDASSGAPYRQRLVWRLSERTLKVLRPTDRLTSLLPTIEEQQQQQADASPPRNRSGSESEEMSDWPRSPVLLYCDN